MPNSLLINLTFCNFIIPLIGVVCMNNQNEIKNDAAGPSTQMPSIRSCAACGTIYQMEDFEDTKQIEMGEEFLIFLACFRCSSCGEEFQFFDYQSYNARLRAREYNELFTDNKK